MTDTTVSPVLFIQDLHAWQGELSEPRTFDTDSAEGIVELAEYLAQWDYADADALAATPLSAINPREERYCIRPSRDDNGHFCYDKPWSIVEWSNREPGDYVLTHHTGLRYVDLSRIIDPEEIA